MSSETLSEGQFAVVSQSQDFIDGYSDDSAKVIYDIPVIIFGDHTKIVKYVDFPFVLGADGTKVLKPILCNPKFLYYLIYDAANKINPKGYARHFKLLKQSILTLPPLEEQQRIVEHIESIFKQIDLIENSQNDYLNLVDVLKKAILQSAIQGTLVEQCEDDEPAFVLLKKIRAEKKAQLGKKYVESYIYKGVDNRYYEHIGDNEVEITQEIPYKLPKNWCWSRIQDISDSYIGLTYKPTDIVQNDGWIVLRSSNIQEGKLDLNNIVRVNVAISEKLTVKKNDIIICARNGSKKLVGKSAIVDIDMPNLTFGAFMAICKTPLYAYVAKFLLSSLFFDQLSNVCGTTTINQLTQNNFNKFLIPIPPLAEQERIVSKINEIFAQL